MTNGMDSKTKHIFNNLIAQVERIYRHARQGSYKTRERYKAAMIRFVAFLAIYFRLQKLANIEDKHVSAYVEYMQAHKRSASTIKTDLAAIRYYHDQMFECKTVISDNNAFNLENRKIGGVDRTWSHQEFIDFIKLADRLKRHTIVYILCLAMYQGLRIHEAFRMDRATAERALITGVLTVKGKNGLFRDIPLKPQIRRMFMKVLTEVQRGDKLFLIKNEDTHLSIKRLQNFIVRHRSKVADSQRDTKLTYHGLRHTYAASEYKILIESGMDVHRAKLEVSRLLGHNREDVTNIYIFAAKESNEMEDKTNEQ